MTIDEALAELDVWTGVDDREKRRDVLTALLAAHGREVAAEALEEAAAFIADDPESAFKTDAVEVLRERAAALRSGGASCDDVARILAAHEREAAVEVLGATRDAVEAARARAWAALKDADPDERAEYAAEANGLAIASDIIHDRAAALREASTTGNKGGQP